MNNLFKAYDIRGEFPAPLSPDFACAIGLALPDVFQPQKCVVGFDARLSGPVLRDALVKSLQTRGVEVASLGMCGTEEIYHAAARGDFDLGIMITGSHNPANENGFKLVTRGAIPVSRDTGLQKVAERTAAIMAATSNPNPVDAGVKETCASAPKTEPDAAAAKLRDKYIDWLIDYSGINKNRKRKLVVVADAGNGSAGLLLEKLAKKIPHEVIALNWRPDGNFPHGVPNPLLPAKREFTAKAVKNAGADLGIAFDGDFDRCFFYDSKGNFIEGYYLVGLLAAQLLARFPGQKVVHDPRVYWNTQEVAQANGGIPIMGKTGHAFMKESMRRENAIYGGEMSAHHYFRDFAYCDSGMLTMLLMLAFLQNSAAGLDEILAARMQAYPCSGEINFRAENGVHLMRKIAEKYKNSATHVDNMDGVNMEMDNWRFNIRLSNTEPLLRLNVESRGNRELMKDKTAEIEALLIEGGAALAQ